MPCKTLNTIGLVIFLLISTITYGAEKELIENLNPSFFPIETQLDSGFNLLGWLPFGPSYALAMKDSFCFVSSGGRIEILLMDSEGNLTKLNEVKAQGVMTDLVIHENYLYAGLGCKGIEIFDISNPQQTSTVGFYQNELGDWIWNLDISYPYIFSANGYHLKIIDVSNPRAPIELSSIGYPPNPLSVTVKDTFLFIGTYQSKLEVYSISNPSSPQLLDSLNLPILFYSYITTMLLSNQYLFIGGAMGYSNNRYLFVVDVSDPSNPILVASDSNFYTVIWDMGIRDSLFYYLSWSSLTVYNIANPVNPQPIYDSLNLGGYRLEIKDSLLIMAVGKEIRVLNINNPTSPRRVSQYNIENPLKDFCVTNDFAFLGRKNDLISVDISDPSNPAKLSSLILSYEISDLWIKDTLIYLTTTDSGLRIINVSNPNNMVEIGRLTGYDSLKNILLKDTLAFVTNGDFLIFNVSDPTNPSFISALTTPAEAAGLFVQENYAYVNDWGYGLIIINISNPSSPFIEGFYERTTRFPYSSLWTYQNYLYVADDYLIIFDISNPNLPVRLHHIYPRPWCNFIDVQVKEEFLYTVESNGAFVIEYPDGVNTYSLEQPSLPQILATYFGPGRSEKLMVTDKIHLLDSKFGYSILELIPVGIEEEKPPFISDFFIKSRIGKAKQILLEYSLPKDGLAKIILYDRTGKKASTLLNEPSEKGCHLLSLSNLTLPAGIYFVILEFENQKTTSKMLFLK